MYGNGDCPGQDVAQDQVRRKKATTNRRLDANTRPDARYGLVWRFW